MCKRKSVMGIVVVISAVALLAWSLVGAQAGARSCANKTATSETATPTSCCGTCGNAASCPLKKAGDAKACSVKACCAKAGTDKCGSADKKKLAKEKSCHALQKIHTRKLPNALKEIDAALEALKQGDQAAAVRHLTKARSNIQTAHAALARHVQSKRTFVNAVCPMMGSPIKPKKVTANLTREHKGRKVAFCCPGCPAAWDKLTNTEKEAKLAKTLVKPSKPEGQKTKP